MLIDEDIPAADAKLRAAMDAHMRADEAACVHALLQEMAVSDASLQRIDAQARRLVAAVRAERLEKGGLDAFLHEYGLSSHEGVLLMCIAEALLRVPDDATQERLIRDKLSAADWDRHLGRSSSLFVNASTWALMLTGRLIRLREDEGRSAGAALRRLIARLGEPVVRESVNQAMRILGRQFVMGRSIERAIDRAHTLEERGYRYSYDMLGEAARTMAAAERYFESYRRAIAAIGKAGSSGSVADRPGISVKLSALHPRFEITQSRRILDELVPRVAALAQDAAAANIGLTIDAEEAERLHLTLDVIEGVAADPALAGWDGLGVVVQTYLKTAPYVVDWLADLAQRHRRRLMVRLVKGAYWDAEIKRSQELGLDGYPVFTRKVSTDLSYLTCARRLLQRQDLFFPQFATHNAHTAAAVLEFAGSFRQFEFQRLHGMGEALYEALIEQDRIGVGCRIYAPVGQHEDLLAYLVRRLLENGANSSFVNRIQDDSLPIEDIIADPIAAARGLAHVAHPRIPIPRQMYLPERVNARGIDLANRRMLSDLAQQMSEADGNAWTAAPVIDGHQRLDNARPVVSPADHSRLLGHVVEATAGDVEAALTSASAAAAVWATTDVEERARCLVRTAELLEARMPALMTLCVREAGKTIADAIAEVREAADFCRYYASRARHDLSRPLPLPVAVAGPRNVRLHGGGVFACISPWNFPLAIFIGQVAAVLVAGNAVVAKPAEQSALMAAEAVRLLHQAGVPASVLHLLPGDGEKIGGALVIDERISGVVFTGSTAVAQAINRTLSRRPRQVPVLIAETGGQNAMIVDSTALPEQVVRDAIASAFQSAGQRCSALRVLFLQDDVADKIIDMLAGAMDELTVGDPAVLSTDVGPVIDADAQAMLERHIARMTAECRLIRRATPGPGSSRGTFVAPVAFELDSLSRLQGEVFGPVLHVIRYPADRLPQVVDAINGTGYGLTLGIQTRIDETWRAIFTRARVGNTYVNRNQIGAVVGVQPFGGQRQSGTGPKAGGPHYLHRFVADHPVSSEPGHLLSHHASAGEIAFDRASLNLAMAAAETAGAGWAATPVEQRVAVLARMTDILEAEVATTAADPDANIDIGHAADYLRFCATRLRAALASPQPLPGPTGERNESWFQPRGIVGCICAGSPLLAAAVAQIAAVVGTGNAAIVWHPDGELIARIVALFRAGGLPEGVMTPLAAGVDGQLADLLGASALAAASVCGADELIFQANRLLGERQEAIVPLIVHNEAATRTALGMPGSSNPHYLDRFVHERTLTVDTTAAGGNASLLSLATEA